METEAGRRRWSGQSREGASSSRFGTRIAIVDPTEDRFNPSEASMEMTGSASHPASDESAKEEVERKAKKLATAAKNEMGSKVDEWKDEGEEAAGKAKQAVADRVSKFSSAIRSAGSALKSDDEKQLGGLGESVADELDRLTGYLRNHDVRGLLGDLEDLGRRRPALFLGGMMATGALVGRFLRATPPEQGEAGADESKIQFTSSPALSARLASTERNRPDLA